MKSTEGENINNMNAEHNLTFDILNNPKKNEQILETQENTFKDKNKLGNININNYENVFNRIEKNENNNIFIINKNDEIENNYNSDNLSCISLIRIMEGRKNKNKKKSDFRSSSFDSRNKNIKLEEIKILSKLSKSMYIKNNKENNQNISNNNVIPYEETENTRIITTAKVRKCSFSSNKSINDDTNKEKFDNGINPKTRIDLVSNYRIKNNISKAVNEIISLSQKYIYKFGDKKKEIKEYLNNNNNKVKENNNKYQHQNIYNRVCLDSIEELYEEENDSKTKSKINKTNSEYNSLLSTEKNNNAKSYQNTNKYKINISYNNTNIKNNIINNTPCISSKYNLGKKNNIFDISSDEEDEKDKIGNNDININYNNNIASLSINNKMNNFEEEQNEFDSNIFIKPLDTLNFNEYENSMSFMNESDINKLFSSPNKKGISFFEHNSSNLNNNNYTFYNKNLNNSALNNRINNRYMMNDENDSNYMNIFNKDKKDIYSKKNFNKTYIKKIIGKELFIKPKINNLKNLISPENLNRYYSSFCHSNNYTLESNGLEIKKNSIKIFKNDNNAKSKQLFKDLKLNENIIHIDIIKNKKYTKIFNQNSCINKINIDIDLNLFTINQIENKRRALNINNNLKTPSDRNLNYNKNEFSYNENKKDETNDMTLFTTDERKNNFSNNLIYNSFKNQSEDYFSKIFITNDFSNSKISTNKYTNDSLKKKREEGITTTPFILEENDIIINDHKNSSHKKAINLKRKHKRNRSRNLINRNNILFFNSVKIYNNNSSFDNDDNEYICKMNNNMSLNSFKGDNDKSNSDKNLEKTDDANNYLNNINRIEINNKVNNQNNINEKENKIIFIDKKDNNILLENKKLFISQNSYEELIQEYISKTKDIKDKLINISNKDNKYNNLINKDKILFDKTQKDIDNKISSFENELKLLKNYYLCLLVKKHFLKNKSEKLKLIKDMNVKEKRDMFKISYLNVINFIQEKFKFDYNNLEIYINKIINIIEKYKNITKYDIKYTKKIYKEEKELSPYTLDIKESTNIKSRNIFQKLFKDDLNTKKIIISTSIILPILCGINFFMSFYANK